MADGGSKVLVVLAAAQLPHAVVASYESPRLRALRTGLLLATLLHADHLDLRSLRKVAGGATVIAPRGCAPLLRRVSAGRVVELAEGERDNVGPITVEAFRAAHDGRRHPLARGIPALWVSVDGQRRHLLRGRHRSVSRDGGARRPRGRRLSAGRRLGPSPSRREPRPEKPAPTVALIRPAVAIPIHRARCARSARREQRFLDTPRPFARAVASLGLPVAVPILSPGESVGLHPRAA